MDVSGLLFILDGVVLGAILSLIAVGLTLIYGLADVLNLSHGEILVAGTVAASVLLQYIGLPLFLSLAAGVLVTVGAGVFIEKIVLRPVYTLEGDERVLLGLYMTLAFSILLHGILITTFPTAYLTVNLPTPTIELNGIRVRTAQIFAGAFSSVILAILFLFLKRSWTGMAIRSLTQNEVGALLVGINVKRYRLLVFVLGSLLVALAGIIRSIVATVGPENGFEFTILALLVCVVGGIRSVYGTIVAGLMIGVVYSFLVYLIGTYLAYVALLAVVMVTLLVRPYGIVGEKL
jgi:branched-chain amino acid transport system permease protein